MKTPQVGEIWQYKAYGGSLSGVYVLIAKSDNGRGLCKIKLLNPPQESKRFFKNGNFEEYTRFLRFVQ